MILPIASTFEPLALVLWVLVIALCGTAVVCGCVCYFKGRCRILLGVCVVCVAALGHQGYEATKSFGSDNAFVRTCIIGAVVAGIAAWVCASRKLK